MLFRYKIDKYREYVCNSLTLIKYDVKIQRYNPDNILFKWTTCKNTSLKSIVEFLGDGYDFTYYDDALCKIFKTISEYGGIDKMMTEYIQKSIVKDMEFKDVMNNLEKSIDDIVLTNDWKTIELKESK